MNPDAVKKLLEAVHDGRTSIAAAMEELRALPFVELGHSTVDTHRALRQGFPEVIYGGGKTVRQIVEVARALGAEANVLVTRMGAAEAAEVVAEIGGTYDPVSRTIRVVRVPIEERGAGPIAVISAGTSDQPVAEEAAVTAEMLGNRVDRIWDVGVAGIHRVMHKTDRLRAANVIVVVAGMEGALPSVVGGLTSRPVIAVPTSVGYGASFGGIAALLGMLNSCASGVVVVNIDNGFGGGYAAALINRKRAGEGGGEG
jgi:NCAIR mutase (PurE)-related protein